MQPPVFLTNKRMGISLLYSEEICKQTTVDQPDRYVCSIHESPIPFATSVEHITAGSNKKTGFKCTLFLHL